MSKYIAIYNKLCPDDHITKDDPRRKSIMSEMRAIATASSIAEAVYVIYWWDCWTNTGFKSAKDFVLAVRREARKS
jgi:hypothetical protein